MPGPAMPGTSGDVSFFCRTIEAQLPVAERVKPNLACPSAVHFEDSNSTGLQSQYKEGVGITLNPAGHGMNGSYLALL